VADLNAIPCVVFSCHHDMGQTSRTDESSSALPRRVSARVRTPRGMSVKSLRRYFYDLRKPGSLGEKKTKRILPSPLLEGEQPPDRSGSEAATHLTPLPPPLRGLCHHPARGAPDPRRHWSAPHSAPASDWSCPAPRHPPPPSHWWWRRPVAVARAGGRPRLAAFPGPGQRGAPPGSGTPRRHLPLRPGPAGR